MGAVRMPFWAADVTIYNPNLQTIESIDAGCTVSVAAGYVSEGQPSEIFRGPVWQALFGKESANTTYLRFHCFLGLDELTNSVVTTVVGAGATQRQTILKMAEGCTGAGGVSKPITFAYLAPESHFIRGALPRSQTIFGTPNDLFANIARSNDMLMTYGPEGMFIGKVDGSGSAEPDVIYAPPFTEGQGSTDGSIRYCLIGTPEQTQLGVDIRVLLDPRLKFKVPCMHKLHRCADSKELSAQFHIRVKNINPCRAR